MQKVQEQSRVGVRTSNSALVAYQVRSLIRSKMLVEDGVEAACLVHVSVDSVLDALGCVATEVI